MHIIPLSGEVTDDMLQQFSLHLSELERKNIKEIRIDICSPGGLFEAGLAIANRIKLSTAKITTNNIAYVGSCAMLIFAAGAKRISSKHSNFMFHTISVDPVLSTVGELNRKVKEYNRDNERMVRAMAEFSGINANIWDKVVKSEKDMNINPEQALKLGLIQKIY